MKPSENFAKLIFSPQNNIQQLAINLLISLQPHTIEHNQQDSVISRNIKHLYFEHGEKRITSKSAKTVT
jgi:hypothetical protein